MTYLSVQALKSTSWILVLLIANHIINFKSFVLGFFICDIISKCSLLTLKFCEWKGIASYGPSVSYSTHVRFLSYGSVQNAGHIIVNKIGILTAFMEQPVENDFLELTIRTLFSNFQNQISAS